MEHIATGYKTTNNFSFVVMSMMAYLSQVLLIWKLCEDISLNTHTHIYLGPTETSIIQYHMKNRPLSPTPMRRIFVPQVRHKKANCNDEVESMAG